jgi:hypothetical protein
VLPEIAMLLGVDPRAVEGTTFTQSEPLWDSAVGAVKLTVKFVLVSTLTPLGLVVTSVTPPVGEPIVYVAVVMSA